MNNQQPTKTIFEEGTGRKIDIFEGNKYIKDYLLKIRKDDTIAKIAIRTPGRWHNNYFILINVRDEGVGDLFKIFLQKKSPRENIGIEKGLIKFNISGNAHRTLSDIEKCILEPFEQYYNIDIQPED